MTKILHTSLVIFLGLMVRTVDANIEVVFIESAPKDRFEIKNVSHCGLNDITVELDLSQSDGRLIFDTSASGAGVEVFQPFEVTEGNITLISAAKVEDGDSHLTLGIKSLLAGEMASFSIDLDDNLTTSELGKTRVTGAEINGGQVKVIISDLKPLITTFGIDSKATVLLPNCP